MELTKCKLCELITQRREKSDGTPLPICGVSKDGLIPPKQIDADTSIYNVFYRDDFIFNPARMELNSIAINDKYDRAICSSLYEVFYVHRTDLLLPHYLKLIVKQKWFTRYCEFLGQGSAREYCRFNNISEIEIEFPSIEEQKKIVEHYTALQNRIAIKKQINDNLEATAYALYKETFITSASDKWDKGTLSDLLTVKYGKDHKHLLDGSIPLFGSGGIMRYVEKSLYNKVSVLIPRKGTLSNVMYVDEPFWSVDTMFYTEIHKPYSAKFIYYFVKSKDLAGMDTGSAVPSMSSEIIHSMQLDIPDDETLIAFDNRLTPLYKQMKLNNQECAELQKLQEVLLATISSR